MMERLIKANPVMRGRKECALQQIVHGCFYGSQPLATHAREARKSGPRFEFNFLARLAIILAFVLIQLPVGLHV
jgi:hypothetical protein